MKNAYLDYSMSVIIGRALPDARDGLKPVHRRILFAMHELSNTHNRAYKKSARIVGDVIGKYHPHGDSAVYDSIVRMAQPFSLRYLMVDGQGNFGSIDGDSAAAMRYTEVRMTKMAEEMLADIEKETVDFIPNYDESLEEPSVLPTRIPGLLLNGSSGIAVGMATSIPPHNSTEIFNALIAQIDNPDISVDELMQIVPGPDFPTGGIIFSGGEIERAYRTGRGIITVRGKVKIEDAGNSRERIVITEIPYTVNKSAMVEKIAMLVNEKRLEDIADIRDESDREGMRVVIDLKRGANAMVIENQLYKLTQLQSSFSMNMLAIHNGTPKTMGLKQLLSAFLDFREEVVTRRCIFELKKAKARIHILEGLLKALANIDEIVELIKKSASPAEAKANLIARFEFSEIQAQAILDMRLQRLTGLEREKIENEYNELKTLIEWLLMVLGDRNELMKVIRDELIETRDQYADQRRSDIIKSGIGDFNVEDLISDEKMVVTITRNGYIKRTELTKYRLQRRGGKGVKGATTRENDFIEHVFIANNHAHLLYFTNLGRIYTTKVYEIPERDRSQTGIPLVNIRPLQKEERICAVLVAKDIEMDANIIMVTRQANIKRMELSNFTKVQRTGIIACSLDEGDEVVGARLTDGNSNIIVGSRKGLAIVFNESDVRVMGRQACGVRAIRLGLGDEVVGMGVIRSEESYVINLTENGFGKKTEVTEYSPQNRGGKGVFTMKITNKTGNMQGLRVVQESDELLIISDSGQIIRTPVAQIRTTGRTAQGVRTIRLEEGEKIVDFTKYVGEEAADELDDELIEEIESNDEE